MKEVQLNSGQVIRVTTRHGDNLILNGIATEVKEEKQAVETKEEKKTPKRSTKSKK
jgi:alpha-acetolactate decarboxylase